LVTQPLVDIVASETCCRNLFVRCCFANRFIRLIIVLYSEDHPIGIIKGTTLPKYDFCRESMGSTVGGHQGFKPPDAFWVKPPMFLCLIFYFYLYFFVSNKIIQICNSAL